MKDGPPGIPDVEAGIPYCLHCQFMELLAQKHRLLAQAVAETKEKLETLKAAAEQANQTAVAVQIV